MQNSLAYFYPYRTARAHDGTSIPHQIIILSI